MARKSSRLWIQEAVHHPGSFTAQANRAGMTVRDFAHHVLSHPEHHTDTTLRRARLALRFEAMGRAKHKAAMKSRRRVRAKGRQR